METHIVKTLFGIEKLIEDLPASTSLLYIEVVQGRKPTGENSISILRILPADSNTVYIVDVAHLEGEAFTTPGLGVGRTAKSGIIRRQKSVLLYDESTRVVGSLSYPPPGC
jgi:hypothetical protein